MCMTLTFANRAGAFVAADSRVGCISRATGALTWHDMRRLYRCDGYWVVGTGDGLLIEGATGRLQRDGVVPERVAGVLAGEFAEFLSQAAEAAPDYPLGQARATVFQIATDDGRIATVGCDGVTHAGLRTLGGFITQPPCLPGNDDTPLRAELRGLARVTDPEEVIAGIARIFDLARRLGGSVGDRIEIAHGPALHNLHTTKVAA
jgi:hypothetical protein